MTVGRGRHGQFEAGQRSADLLKGLPDNIWHCQGAKLFCADLSDRLRGRCRRRRNCRRSRGRRSGSRAVGSSDGLVLGAEGTADAQDDDAGDHDQHGDLAARDSGPPDVASDHGHESDTEHDEPEKYQQGTHDNPLGRTDSRDYAP